MTNFRTDPNGEDPSDTRTGDVAEPGRIVGQVFNDIYFERNRSRPGTASRGRSAASRSASTPGVDTVCPNVQPAVRRRNNWRLLTTVTTSPDGSYEALLPSTETLNCPIPQGPCPGMYLVTVDDPGTKAAPERRTTTRTC